MKVGPKSSLRPSLHRALHLLFCSAMVSFHSGVHQNKTICHLIKKNKNFGVAG